MRIRAPFNPRDPFDLASRNASGHSSRTEFRDELGRSRRIEGSANQTVAHAVRLKPNALKWIAPFANMSDNTRSADLFTAN